MNNTHHRSGKRSPRKRHFFLCLGAAFSLAACLAPAEPGDEILGDEKQALDEPSIPIEATYETSLSWTNTVGVQFDGSALSRVDPNGGWNAGASSVEEISSGDGYFEFSTNENDKSKMAGLGNGDSDQGYGDIDFAIYLRWDSGIDIYEGGWYQGYFGTYAAGDVFRVEVADGQVRYRKNGQVFHSSYNAPVYPLRADTSFEQFGGTISNASFASCAAGDKTCIHAEAWTHVGFAVSNASSLKRTPGNGWSAGASSVKQIASGDGYATFSTAENHLSKMAGLSHGDSDRGYGDIDYGIFLRWDSGIDVYEGGWYQGYFGTYEAGDVFQVEVVGGQVRYRKNGQVFHSSYTPPVYPLVLDTSLEHGGATLTNVSVASCTPGDTTCIHAETWKNVGFAASNGTTLQRSPGNGWNAGASSIKEIGSGDGFVEFSTAENNTSKMAGLSHGDTDRGYGDIDYAIFLRWDGGIDIYEGGWYQGYFGTYQPGDVFRVEVAGGQVRYRKNGNVFHASYTAPVYPLVLDTSLENGGATITMAKVESCAPGDESCMPAEMWKNVGSASTKGGDVTRLPGNSWSAGASSVEEIAAGSGYAEFSTAESNTSKMAGLSHGDTDRGYGDIDYAIFLRWDGGLEIYEGGWYQGYFGTYQAGDVFRVEAHQGQVRYRKNGKVFHTSATAPTYPLVLDTSFYDGGATLKDATIKSCVAGDTACMPAEYWKNVGFATADGSALTRTPGNSWDGGGSSYQQIAQGDGYVQFSTAETNTSKMAGLGAGDTDRGYGDIDYAIFLRWDGGLEVYESGWYQGTFGTYAAGDIFRVELTGNTVYYKKNGQVFHMSQKPPIYPLVLDASLYDTGATITNAVVVGAQTGSGCGPVTAEGYCNDDVLVWCENDEVKTHDCAADGKICGYQNATIGYNCLVPPVGGGTGLGFGYPVGDKTTHPAGGWEVVQPLGHYLHSEDGQFVGGHLAQDIGTDEATTANAPVYAVADGEVLYAGWNQSTYVNVVLIKHDLGNGQKICSFYGHLGTTTVSAGQVVHRGDQIATILDWLWYFGKPMSHLHYVLLSEALCDASDAANGALICGYDDTSSPNGITLANEPAVYTSVGDICGDQNYPNAFISPSQFIQAHHF